VNGTFDFRSLAGRISMLAVLFGGEALEASLLFDGATPVPSGAWLAALVHSWGSPVARFAIAFAALFATFAFLRYKSRLKSISTALGPIRWGLLAAHFAAIGLFWVASIGVYGDRLSAHDSNLAAVGWIFAAAAAISAAALAALPWKFWSDLAHTMGYLWIYAAAAAALTCEATAMLRSLWGPASRVTFRMVQLFLSPFTRDMVIQPDRLRIGTHRFTVIIANECSGLEGIGLLLVFGCMWLVLFRKEARFPQALVLLPLGVVTLFLLNAFRITALILIGNAGARDIAAGGFHSQAGWIAFNSVAFGSSIVARRWRWVSVRTPAQLASDGTAEAWNPTTAFLAPFLAILAAGMISRAASGGFEWLYPIRFFAALAALWVFRRSYSHLDWKWSMLAPATGIAVFLLWIAADHLARGTMPMPGALANAPAPARFWWIGLRIFGAVFTVPVAEELAFRGFLLRRFREADFDSVPFQSTSWLAVLGSSVLFGLMHGERWLIATLAGAAYALLIRRTGRMGDAVVAHGLTNGLLAVMVLGFGQWQLW
jgi:exosortase E/protease (VPEID-CTERM system)